MKWNVKLRLAIENTEWLVTRLIMAAIILSVLKAIILP